METVITLYFVQKQFLMLSLLWFLLELMFAPLKVQLKPVWSTQYSANLKLDKTSSPNLYSPGTCEVWTTSYSVLPVKMWKSYKSPSKVKRNSARLIKHLINIINKKPKLSFQYQNYLEILPRRTPELSKSVSVYTNCPDPCNFCQKHQCTYDFNHGLVFSVSAALEESLVASISTWNKKPPDDACGWMVPTHK